MATDNISDTLQNSVSNFDIECEKFLDRVSNKLMRKVKPKTPVDTGLARRNWTNTKTGVRERSISNNTDYILHLEYPHRTRGGKGIVKGHYMLTKSVAELENELDAELQKFMDNLWK